MNTIKENNQADQMIVGEVLRGNTNAFADIIKCTERLVAQVVFKMIPNKEDRRDIVQDIYLKAFNKLSSFKFEAKLSTWIAQIAYNTCFNYLEKKKLVLVDNLPEADQADDDISNSADLKNMLDVEIEKLPAVYQTLISLYHIEDCSYDEIAHITSLPQGTVKNYLFRARKALKESISKKYKREDL